MKKFSFSISRIGKVCISALLLFSIFFNCIPIKGNQIIESFVAVPIIMYHSLCQNEVNNFTITPEKFEKDLQYLADNGYNTVTITDLIDFVYHDKQLPEKPIVLTFDDGYYDNYLYALPLLKKYDMRMVVSIIGEQTQKWNDAGYNDELYGHVSWEQISQMIDSGHVEIGNHTQLLHWNNKGRDGSMRKKGEDLAEYKKVLTEDLGYLQEQLTNNCNVTPLCFTYPFGSISKESRPIIEELGFKASLSCTEGMNYISSGDKDSLFSLKRVNRAPSRSIESILKKLNAK